MRIVLIGYGRMGKSIEKLATEIGWNIVDIIESSNDLKRVRNLENIDTAIEFTTPTSAFTNIKSCLEAGIPTITGTTGWEDQFDKAKNLVETLSGTLFVASNFSIGMNIVFEANRKLVELANRFGDYKIRMIEEHHQQKLDIPSGTAISLAKQIIEQSDQLDSWTAEAKSENQLEIQSRRFSDTLGIHEVIFESSLDSIQLRHEAKSRDAFSLGVIGVAKWMKGKQGFLTMRDFLNL